MERTAPESEGSLPVPIQECEETMGGKLERNPDLVWRDEPERREEIVNALIEGADVGEEGWVILVDGGEMHQLNLLAGDIWMLCDGTLDEKEIALRLLAAYDADASDIECDVAEFAEDFLNRGFLVRKG